MTVSLSRKAWTFALHRGTADVLRINMQKFLSEIETVGADDFFPHGILAFNLLKAYPEFDDMRRNQLRHVMDTINHETQRKYFDFLCD